ncbi:hypothetical protein K438DRAFT_1878227 [Mycena galopus ATCC 62051]|nr:hypothetical protein K438DRAFT_1878227 [Mycena galopus ATCC 62051]
MRYNTVLTASLHPKTRRQLESIKRGLALRCFLVQDPAAPPFVQSVHHPIFYKSSGQAWMRDGNGQWVLAPDELVPPPPQPPIEQRGDSAPAQGQLQPAIVHHFGPAFGVPVEPPSAPHVLSSGHTITNRHIDPRLLALPEDDDHDGYLSPYAIAKDTLRPALKVGGARQKTKDTKGKKCQRDSDSSNDSDDDTPAPKCGRPQGSTNFAKEDIKKLFDIMEKTLPIGQKGWKVVESKYNKYALANDKSERNIKSLQTKYNQILRKKKPTGRAVCPPEIKRAHHIEGLIDQRANTRVLSDSDVDVDVDGGGDPSSDEGVEVVPPASSVRTAVARRAPSPPIRRSHVNAPDLVNTISKVFDPEAQKTCETDRAQRSFQTTHLFSLTQQLRDAQTANENLRNQITTMQTRVHDVERARDRAEMKLEMVQVSSASGSVDHRRSRSAVYKDYPDLVRVNGKVRNASTDDDAEKENRVPQSSSSHSRHSRTHFNSSFDLECSVSPLPTANTTGPSAADGGAN